MLNVVAPLVGAWIEILHSEYLFKLALVAPLVGAWIEIMTYWEEVYDLLVAPLVGAWIEIQYPSILTHSLPSLLSWERGLK